MNTEYFFNPVKIYLSTALYFIFILFVAGIAVCGLVYDSPVAAAFGTAVSAIALMGLPTIIRYISCTRRHEPALSLSRDGIANNVNRLNFSWKEIEAIEIKLVDTGKGSGKAIILTLADPSGYLDHISNPLRRIRLWVDLHFVSNGCSISTGLVQGKMAEICREMNTYLKEFHTS